MALHTNGLMQWTHRTKIYTRNLLIRYISLWRSQNVENLAHLFYDPPEKKSISRNPFFITHGLLGSKVNWKSIAKIVSKVTNRNHGDSPHTREHSYDLMAEDVLELSKSLNINKFTLMGHSMGGRTVMVFALRYPEYLDKLVVVDVSPISMNPGFHNGMKGYLETMLNIKFEEKKKFSLSEARKIANDALMPVVSESSIRSFLLTNLAELEGKIFWKPNLPVLLETMEDIGHFPTELLQKTFNSSTLFIRGEHSMYIPETDFPGILKLFPNAEFDTINNAGHWPYTENPKDFLESLVPFLQS